MNLYTSYLFGFLLVVFTYAANKCNQVSFVKRTKEGTREENKALQDGQPKGKHDSHRPAATVACQGLAMASRRSFPVSRVFLGPAHFLFKALFGGILIEIFAFLAWY